MLLLLLLFLFSGSVVPVELVLKPTLTEQLKQLKFTTIMLMLLPLGNQLSLRVTELWLL